MIIKMNQVIAVYQTCLSFRKEKMGLRTAYKFNRLIDRLEQEVIFYNKKFDEIVQTYAEMDENNKPIFLDDVTVKIKEEKTDECQMAMSELDNLEIEVEPVIFTLDELESLNVSIESVNSLMPFIQE